MDKPRAMTRSPMAQATVDRVSVEQEVKRLELEKRKLQLLKDIRDLEKELAQED